MKLWLDDRRKPPFGYDLWAKTYEECVGMLLRHGEKIEACSLDHDLHEDHYEPDPGGYMPPPPLDRSKYTQKTGYAVVEWLVANNYWPPEINVHSLNQRGVDDMLRLLRANAPPEVSIRRVKPSEI